jgi:hypothetical protein
LRRLPGNYVVIFTRQVLDSTAPAGSCCLP